MSKRLFDIGASALGLILLAPLLLLATLWIKLDSPGPALFRQTRVGRFGQPFTIHKFRTMRVEPGAAITVGADPRITRSGALLRATKLDELPQLWDVLRGAMSLVGPRPELPRYVELYPTELRNQVLAVRPGITDPASLAFSHEAELLAAAKDPEREYREVILPAKLKLSAGYAARASLATDLKLILQTLSRVLHG
ncbi:sugar transferase [Roseateles saccharophilus]|uniref:Lipopolysaccharide/colanic/teichoic acid biosynthesis glycosyltransferase n=1 Tax=Roseateles saccharophilus TaxID=304 RepID=A0A4R3U416_ROSSA|nr:sugar transferase [Roseateles saccharophilus]MDG0836243.1 sugar transferase [Roseateles saccharophilus]TCU81287.1 lipopolysaccharide/colanic/teichoic acid biosynthesis glycosyltransferase [Roseateles saccharophilus]